MLQQAKNCDYVIQYNIQRINMFFILLGDAESLLN